MSWNYRVVKKDQYYGICEVYYDNDGKIEGWTDFIEPVGDAPDELREDMEYMMKAFQLPVLYEKPLHGIYILVEQP